MNTKKMTQEQISAFADGEFADMDAVLATLRHPEGHASWDIYHQIGDVLRSDEMAVRLSTDFTARLMTRLETESTIVAPMSLGLVPPVMAGSQPLIDQDRQMAPVKFKRFAISGAVAAAAVAAIACITTPQLMVATKKNSTFASGAVVVASAKREAAPAVSALPVASQSMETTLPAQEEAVVLRDPRIDDYLLAHQRFSPSVYNIAQYARSATFTTDSGK